MIPHDWVKGAKTPDQKQKLEVNLRASQTMIQELLRITQELEQNIVSQETQTSDYDSPAWAYKQAHRNGQRSITKRLRDLLEPLQTGT